MISSQLAIKLNSPVKPPSGFWRSLFSRNKRVLLPLLLCSFTSISFSAVALEKPGESNTGPTSAESALTKYSGSYTVSSSGTVIEGVILNGTLTISASNVTVRNFILRTDSYYGIQIKDGATGIVIEDGLIENMQSAAIMGSNFTARRLEIRNSGADAIKPEYNFLIEGNWLHHLGYNISAHADGVQIVSGGNGVIRGNFFDMPPELDGYRNSQCFMIQTNNSGVDNILIEQNWINGGGYSVQVRDKGNGYGAPTNVRILNNRFGTDYLYGIWRLDGNPVTEGNVWDATGLSVSNQTGGGDTSTEEPTVPVVQLDAPGISPSGGAFLMAQAVTLSSNYAGAEIHYTLDGSTPTAASPLYSSPLLISKTTMLQAIAVASGADDSFITQEEYTFNNFTSIDEWSSIEIPTKTGEFSLIVDFTPSSNSVDSVVGIASGPGEAYNDLAAIFRFAPEGVVDVRNGSIYQADTQFNYVANTTYRVTMQVDVAQGTYTVSIGPEGGESTKIANNYAFRTEQSGVSMLNNVAYRSIGEANEISAIRFGAIPNPPEGISVTPQ